MLSAIACLLAFITRATANVYVYTMDIPHTIAQEFPDMPATFGGEVPMTGLRGLLVQGEPEDGCSALPPPPQVTDNFTGKWMVLLARYNCSFEIKIRNAQAAGYDCAIVHNVNSSDLETMSAKNPDGILIPSTFVSDTTGQALIEAYLYTYGRYYIMLDGISPYNINSLLVPFAVVVVLCLVVILIFMIVKCIKDRRRARRHRLPNRFLKKIPTCKFSKGDPYDTCAICLDDYQEGERLRVLPCAHAYHSKCIDPWLTQNRRVCPVCKRRVLAAGEPRARSDSDSDTEPLLPDTDTDTDRRPHTQGGTFDEQTENPFVRAVRHMMHLRRQHERALDAERAQRSSETDIETEQTNSGDTAGAGAGAQAEAGAEETQSLVTRAERRPRRSRRERRAQRQNASINSDTRGEIGVAALPVSPADAALQHMIL